MFWSSVFHPRLKASFQWHTNEEQVAKRRRNSGKESNPLGDKNRISEGKDTRKKPEATNTKERN
jgi:hypothetical protein